ncbi:MAG: hypothetical protein MJY93_05610 [Fibrobacter sp.]|nr:hypothetical protein [Fibrobacter sp.]
MSKNPYYWGNVMLTDGNEFTMEDSGFEHGVTHYENNWIESSKLVQDLINGNSVTLTGNYILIGAKEKANLPKLTKAIDTAYLILQKCFQMECNDKYGLHRSVATESVKIYPYTSVYNTNYYFEIEFDLVANLAEYDPKKLMDIIKREGFVELKSDELMNVLNFSKLAHDNPSEYKITKNQWRYWIHRRKMDSKKIWDYYASQIWNSTKNDDTVTRLMQLSCPNTELRQKLQEMNSSNNNILKSFSSDLFFDAVNIEALNKISDLRNDKSFPEKMDIRERVGSYIIQQIRECPEKYLDSDFSFIKEYAGKIIAEKS